MGRLAELKDIVDGLESPTVDAVEEFTESSIDLSPVLKALGEIAEQLGGIDSVDMRQPVRELLQGIAGIVKTLPTTTIEAVDLSPVVRAIDAIQFPEHPVYEFHPVTFDIRRDERGQMTQVIAVEGAPERVKPESVGTIE